ncbi:MAG: hypothetical protein IJA59_01840 [Clostridia bacterium]|nr:hypothetical protein [Clostridia bacterium]
MLSLLYLAAYLIAGVGIAHCLVPRVRVLARVWIGLTLGILLMMWLPALLAFFVDFSVLGHMLALIPLGAITAGAYFLRDKAPARVFAKGDKQLLIAIAAVALPLTVLGGYLQYTHCLREVNGALHVGQSTYGDLPLHLGIITSLRDAAFPPDYSILPGEKLTYPFLMDSFSTSFMLFGMPLNLAVVIPGTLMMALVFSGYMILASRMASGWRALILSTLFVFINGGLGFLYSIDMLGVSLGDSSANSLQSGTWWERIETILNGWYLTPANHAEQSYYNLRWSNIIVDMFVPQRTFLGGWCILLPCIYLLYDVAEKAHKRARGFGREPSAVIGVIPHSEEERLRVREENGRFAGYNVSQLILLSVMAGGLPLLHTHSFLALGLLSAGWMIYDLCHRGKILPWLLYGGLACLLAAPQLFGWTFQHTTGNTRFVYFQFNWVNNSGGWGMRDGYLWFWIKNIGVPVILLILSLLEKDRKRRFIASGAFVIFAISEFIIFQPNEYDNNKLFYVWWALCAVLAADYAVDIFDRLKGLRARYVMAGMLAVCCFATGTLSIAREVKSDYQMFSKSDVELAEWVEENTDKDDTFICWTQHINPVSALAGRDIVCGPGLWLYYHGYNLSERESDIRAFYQDPANNRAVLDKYSVDYILLGGYEYNDARASAGALTENFDCVYEAPDGTRIFSVGDMADD